ncbi:MAG: LiaI-LiaF-like domain-containing protein [Runella sp.]
MNQQSIFWGILLVLIGGLLLLREFIGFDFQRYFWPILMIAIGVMLIFKDKLKRLP